MTYRYGDIVFEDLGGSIGVFTVQTYMNEILLSYEADIQPKSRCAEIYLGWGDDVPT